MPIRPLTLSAMQEAKARKLVEYAEDPKHWYYPEKANGVPGNLPEYQVKLDSFRCVYTHTVVESTHFRHLSISVPGEGFPNPVAAFNIAVLFGFKGAVMENGVAVKPGEDWGLDINDEEHCAVIVQEIKKEG